MASSTTLDSTTLLHLDRIFEQAGWNRAINRDKVFNRFAALLDNLTENQQQLLLKLTTNFLWVRLDDYSLYIQVALLNIPDDHFGKARNIYVMPLRQTGRQKTDSSIFVSYYFDSSEVKDQQIFEGRTLHITDTISALKGKNIEEHDRLLLVDDFIGSGSQAETSIAKIIEETGIPSNRITVVCLVAQQQGIDRLRPHGIQIFSGETRKKGITDYYISPDLESYLAEMEAIERWLRLRPEFHFGYGKCEALVAMVKTPNNTFPIFWRQYLKGSKSYEAPFPRYRK